MEAADAHRVRVLIADEHPVVREGLRALLDVVPGVEPIGTVADEEQTRSAVRALHPDVVLLDIGFQTQTGPALARRLKLTHPEVALLLFPIQASGEQLAEAMAAGASGIVLKTAPVPEVVSAIIEVASGGYVVDPDLTPAPAAQTLLTMREAQVVRLLILGRRTREIGDELFISPGTVKRHVANISQKLGVSHRGAIVAEALRRGWVA